MTANQVVSDTQTLGNVVTAAAAGARAGYTMTLGSEPITWPRLQRLGR